MSINEDLKTRLQNKLGKTEGKGAKPSRLAIALENADNYLSQSSAITQEPLEGEVIVKLHATSVDPNPYQHRTHFNQAKIDELRVSMELNGQNQPIGVRRHGDRYQIIFGERRWRAALGTEHKMIDAVIRDISDLEMHYVCLSENTNREAIYDYERWIGIQSLLEIERPVNEITSRMGISVQDYYKIRCFGAFPTELKEFLDKHPAALQRNDAQEVAKMYKDFGADIPEGFADDLINLMEMYLKKEIKSRGEIIKKMKAKYVQKKSRNREKVNEERQLVIDGNRVGTFVRTPSEVRIVVDKSELSQDKVDEFEQLMQKFFEITEPA